MRNDGVTLVELIIVIAIIGIIVLFATIDTGWFQRDARVSEARDKLLADIEDAKLKSITTVPHGIVVATAGATSYTVKQLKDYRCSNSATTACLADSDCTPGTCTVAGNFKRDTGEATSDLSTPAVSSNTKIKVTLTGGTELWFDRKGVPRTSTWTTDGNCSITSATVCNDDSDCPASESCIRSFTVWYDDNGNNAVDAGETSKTIIISVTGRVKYEQ